MNLIKKIPALILIYLAMALPAYSWDLGAGVTSYYSIWTPAFIKKHDNAKIDPAILVGPVITFQFYDKFVLTGQAMISLPGTEANYTVKLPSAGNVSVTSTCQRFEAESSLMYSLHSYLKIFAGYKIIEFQESELRDIKIENSLYSFNVDIWDNEYRISGPGTGFLITLPIAENLKVTAGTSILYFSMAYQGYFLNDTYGTTVSSNKNNSSYHGLGNNSSIVLSYYFPSLDTALNLGVRCQYLKYYKEGDSPELGSDLNYGATLTAMYFF